MKLNQTKISFIVFATLLIFSFALFSYADENSTSDKNIFLDSDQDGLSDDEEITYGTNPSNRDSDGDGYSDGAEVRSGYDPLKPAPGDKIVQKQEVAIEETGIGDEKNLTTEISKELADLITERAAENKTITTDDLNSMIEEVAGPALSYEDLPEVDTSEIKIKKQNYSNSSKEKREEKEKEDAEEYLVAVSYILLNNSPQKISNIEEAEDFSSNLISQVSLLFTNPSDSSYFENLAERGENMLEQFKEVEVPENLLDIHIEGIKLAKFAIGLRDKSMPDPEDPIGTIANLSRVQNFISLSLQFAEDLTQAMPEIDLEKLPIDLE